VKEWIAFILIKGGIKIRILSAVMITIVLNGVFFRNISDRPESFFTRYSQTSAFGQKRTLVSFLRNCTNYRNIVFAKTSTVEMLLQPAKPWPPPGARLARPTSSMRLRSGSIIAPPTLTSSGSSTNQS